MSGNSVPTTIEDIHAQAAQASAADVIKAQTAAAPSDPFEAFMAKMNADMAQVKAVLGLSEPLVNEAAAMTGALAPVGTPVLDRLALLEQVAFFQGRPSLPAPAAAPAR